MLHRIILGKCVHVFGLKVLLKIRCKNCSILGFSEHNGKLCFTWPQIGALHPRVGKDPWKHFLELPASAKQTIRLSFRPASAITARVRCAVVFPRCQFDQNQSSRGVSGFAAMASCATRKLWREERVGSVPQVHTYSTYGTYCSQGSFITLAATK